LIVTETNDGCYFIKTTVKALSFSLFTVDFYSRKGIICGLYKRSVLLMNLGVHLG